MNKVSISLNGESQICWGRQHDWSRHYNLTGSCSEPILTSHFGASDEDAIMEISCHVLSDSDTRREAGWICAWREVFCCLKPSHQIPTARLCLAYLKHRVMAVPKEAGSVHNYIQTWVQSEQMDQGHEGVCPSRFMGHVRR